MFSIVLRLFLTFNLINYIHCRVKNDRWWNNRHFYQLNVKSFKDTDGDGIGDINGILSGMNHLMALNVDAVLLSPIFDYEENCDRYGVKDFYKIDNKYGDDDSLFELFSNFKKAGIKIILDMNFDEISTNSDWFRFSSNKEQGFEDFFVWQSILDRISENSTYIDCKYDWRWDENRKEHYLVMRDPLVGYPVLNYKSKGLRGEIKNVLMRWATWDISGFRLFPNTEGDVIETMTYLKNSIDQCFGNDLDCKPLILIGDSSNNIKFKFENPYKSIRSSFHLVFDENLISLNEKSSARDIKFHLDKTMTYFKGIQPNTWTVGNSKTDRLIDRIGYRNSINMIFLSYTLPGNLVTYQGDEIGMSNVDVDYEENCRSGYVLEAISPFQWDDSMNSGFSSNSDPWLKVSRNYLKTNLEVQKMGTTLNPFKINRFLSKAKQSPLFRNGRFDWLYFSDNSLVFSRIFEDKSMVVALNFGTYSEFIDLIEYFEVLTVIFATPNSDYEEGFEIKERFLLQSGEGLILIGSKQSNLCKKTKPVDAIVDKLTDAMHRINAFLSS